MAWAAGIPTSADQFALPAQRRTASPRYVETEIAVPRILSLLTPGQRHHVLGVGRQDNGRAGVGGDACAEAGATDGGSGGGARGAAGPGAGRRTEACRCHRAGEAVCSSTCCIIVYCYTHSCQRVW